MDDLVAASLRRLRAFLVVCDTLHLGRAAERLGIAQPALSQQIRGLEDGLGVKLFNRRKRGIDLTAAGEAYRSEATRLLRLHADAAEEARRVARGEMGTLAIGYVPSAMFNDRFPTTLTALHRAVPDLRIDLSEDNISGLLRALTGGEVDIIVVRAPVTLPETCRHRHCASERLMVVLPESHPLTRKRRVSLADLAAEAMIGFDDPDDYGVTQIALDAARGLGRDLRIQWRVSGLTGVLGLAAAGQGYGLVPESASRIALAGVSFRPLIEEAIVDLWYVWTRDRVSPPLKGLLSMLESP